MNVKEIVCPVSRVYVDSNVSRLTSFIVVILLGIFIVTSISYFLVIAVLDYFIRVFIKPSYSLLRWVAMIMAKAMKMNKKEINEAPKIFASRLGFLCTLASVTFFCLGMSTTSMVIAFILFILTFMDSVFNFCVGCLIYHTIVFPFYNKKMKHQ